MRHANEFTVSEWLTFLPLKQAFKQLRNDALLSFYQKKQPQELASFLEKNRHLAGKNIAIVIAFEQPWALNWLLKMAKKNVADVTIIVFDNSRKEGARAEIERVCNEHGAPYLALPPYQTRHVNRSHGMAMSWVYHNVVRALKPAIFGYLDHDLIPVDKVDFSERVGTQPIFGLINAGKFGTWSTWAGYCMFKYDAVKNQSLNFLYDFSRDLDTGGRNWDPVYSRLSREKLRFASRAHVKVKLPSVDEARLVEFIDERWVHIGGISYNDNLKAKFEFFNGLEKVLDEGVELKHMCLSET
jgi:hypothetical protein